MGKPDRHQTGCVVIGAGVVGLACARALALAGQDVVLLERHAAIGAETSSRNSEVIHAGLYYAPGSLKARFCVDGKHRLYAYCAERGVAHRRCGKLIVAVTPGEAAKLEGVKARAEANGVHDLKLLSGAEAMALEPALSCSGAALSPSTGIVDSHGLMTSLLGDFEDAGGLYARTSAVVGGRMTARGGELIVQSEGDADIARLSAPLIVNAAGLEASRLLQAIDGFPPALVPPLRLAKGQYFAYRGRAPFQRLIYPLPVDGGLGVHVTL
ncbi:MAG: FAD-dependent oxidoreductase, partial [Pseudomonadota bacterium]